MQWSHHTPGVSCYNIHYSYSLHILQDSRVQVFPPLVGEYKVNKVFAVSDTLFLVLQVPSETKRVCDQRNGQICHVSKPWKILRIFKLVSQYENMSFQASHPKPGL